jgi:ribonucleoside-diphosphate reductase alpha chain
MSKLSNSAQQICEARYFMDGENEDWEKCTYRVADSVSSVESERLKYRELFHQIMNDMEFLPGGRILRNCGRARGSLFNCYVVGVGDSMEEILNGQRDAGLLWSDGGGVGFNFSPLRPKGDQVRGPGGETSGPLSFLESYDALAKTVKIGGGRRAAALASLDISHPDIVEFLDAKLEDGKFPHFNFSVNVTNQFLESVEADAEIELKFNQRVYGKVKARTLWDRIIKNMVSSAEPGLLNTTNLYRNNSYFFDQIIATNPCGEIPLGDRSCCLLGSIVLPKFLTSTGKTNWKHMEDTIYMAVRFLDNVLEVNKYRLPSIEVNAKNSRRIGLGYMGIAEYLFAKKVRYGSKDSIDEVEKLAKNVRNFVYSALIKLSVEKGAFPKFDPAQYGKADFIRSLPASLRKDIKTHGTRCVTGLAIAPNGTIALIPEVTGGIEPLFAKAYMRKDRVGNRMYIDPHYKAYIESGETDIPEWLVDSYDLKPEDHLEMQSTVQKYIDSSVSKTINLPKSTTASQLSSLLLEYLYDLKGVTVYRDGSKKGQVLNVAKHEDVLNYIKSGKETTEELKVEQAVKCKSGQCEL